MAAGRTKLVKIGEKQVTVAELRIGELEALADKWGGDGGPISALVSSNTSGDALGVIRGLLYERLPELFPTLTPEDVRNAYPSEIEALVEAFVDANFTGARRVLAPLWTVVQSTLARR